MMTARVILKKWRRPFVYTESIYDKINIILLIIDISGMDICLTGLRN